MRTFGQALGDLIRSKREGVFTQLELALEAYDDETKVRRIVELETGRIARPQQKTIQPIIDTLNITQEEIEACRKQPTLDQEAMDAISLSRALLEQLARRFDHDQPDARVSELEEYLRTKADEWSEFRIKIEEVRGMENQLANILTEAEVLISKGEFGEVESILSDSEELQDERILMEVRSKSRLREMRGLAALLANDRELAVLHFEKSATVFRDIDRVLEAESRYHYASELRSFGYRYRDVSVLRSAGRALVRNLKLWSLLEDREGWCRSALALAGVRWRLAHFGHPQNSVKHLGRASIIYDRVLEICSATKFPDVYVTALCDSANLLRESMPEQSDQQRLSNLAACLERQQMALALVSKENNARAWGILKHNIGCTHISLARIRNSNADVVLDLERAISSLESSFDVRDEEENFQYWLASCRSLSEALISLAHVSKASVRDECLRRARALLTDAIQKTSPSEHPNQRAELDEQYERL